MAWAASTVISAVSAGANILGAMNAGDAASSAADAQVQSADKATAEQRRQYDLTRADNEQFRNTGVAANQRLAQLLGLSGGPSTSGGGSQTRDQIYKDLLNQYDAQHRATYGIGLMESPDQASLQSVLAQLNRGADDAFAAQSGPTTTNPAVDGYGSLLKKFSTEDLNADPVYQSGLQFGLDQGVAGINSRAMQNGSYDSGATLKALTRFGNDYGSTKANEAYNRYNTTNDSIYNKLAGVSGSGQQATNQVSAAGSNMANNVSANEMGAGNARAASIVGGANAWNGAAGALSGIGQNYQNNQILQKLLKGGGSYGSLAGTSPEGYY